jgi:hypothetical protein
MPLWMHLGLCIPIISSKQIVIYHLANTLKFLKELLLWQVQHWMNNKEVHVFELLNANDLECQLGMFKLIMKSNVAHAWPLPLTQTF